MKKIGFIGASIFATSLVLSSGAAAGQEAQSTSSPGSSSSSQVINSSENLKQFSIKDQQGQNVGQIDQVLVDVQQGKIGYIVTSAQQAGQKQVIPWSALQANPQQQSFTLQMSSDQLQQAPQTDPQTVLQNPNQARQIDQFYGVSPEWGGTQGQQRIKNLEDLKQFSLQDQQGQALGRIDRVLVDVQRGQIGYILTSSQQQPAQKRLVPWNAVRVDPQKQTVTLQISANRFQQAPTGDEQMVQDTNKARQIHQFFGVSPYWESQQQRQQQQQQPQQRQQQ